MELLQDIRANRHFEQKAGSRLMVRRKQRKASVLRLTIFVTFFGTEPGLGWMEIVHFGSFATEHARFK
jgi:hypothetical protein